MTDGVYGLRELLVKLSAVERAINFRPVLEEVAPVILSRIKARFLSETDPTGQAWPQSASAMRRGGRTLYDTGALYESLSLETRDKEARFFVDPTATNPRTGANVLGYALKHQEGLDGMPQRMFLGFSEDDMPFVLGVVERRLAEALK